jgi:hypothetical protein
VHLVTLLEEMPVQETIDGVAELEAADLPVGGVMVNLTRMPVLTPAQLTAAESGTLPADAIRRSLARCGLSAHENEIVPALMREASDHAERVALEEREMARIEELARPTFVLPLLPSGVDLGGLYQLADVLAEGGVG